MVACCYCCHMIKLLNVFNTVCSTDIAYSHSLLLSVDRCIECAGEQFAWMIICLLNEMHTIQFVVCCSRMIYIIAVKCDQRMVYADIE